MWGELVDWLTSIVGEPTDLLGTTLRAVFEGIVVAGVLSAGLWVRRFRARKAARRQIGDQLLRVLGLRLVDGRLGSGPPELVELPPDSIRGREALGRLQWQVDLYRDYLSFAEVTTIQNAIEGLDRVAANPGSASYYYAKDALPKLARSFLPRRVRPLLAAHVEGRHWSQLLATREDFERMAGQTR